VSAHSCPWLAYFIALLFLTGGPGQPGAKQISLPGVPIPHVEWTACAHSGSSETACRFRATFVTAHVRARLGESGADAFAIMQLMGHSKIQTTLEYVQISSQDVFQQYARAVAQQIRRFPAAQS